MFSEEQYSKMLANQAHLLANLIQDYAEEVYSQAALSMKDAGLDVPNINLFSQCFSVGMIEALGNIRKLASGERPAEGFSSIVVEFDNMQKLLIDSRENFPDIKANFDDIRDEQEQEDPYNLFNSDYLELDDDGQDDDNN